MKKKFIPIVALASLLTLGGVVTTVTSCDNSAQKEVNVTDVKIALESATIKVGETTKAKVTITPEEATNKEYTITSSDTKVATVSGDTITAIGKGTTEIKVTTKDGNKTSSATLTVVEATVSVTGVKLTLDKTTIKVGETSNATIAVSPENATNKEYELKSANDKIAKVDGTVITAISEGQVDITVTTKDGNKQDTVKLTVEALPKVDPKLVYEGETTFTVQAGVDLALPKIKALSGDGKTDITNLMEAVDTTDSKAINADYTKFNSKIAGEHKVSYYIEEGEGEELKSDELILTINVTPVTAENFEVTAEDNVLENMKTANKTFKENFANGIKSPLYKAIGDANGASHLSATSDAIAGNSLIIDFNKTCGSAANALYLTLNDSLPRGVAKNYIVEFDFKIIEADKVSDVYFGLRYDGFDGTNVQFANGKKASDGVVHFRHKFAETTYPTENNAGFFFFRFPSNDAPCRIAIDNFQITTTDVASFTKVVPTADQLKAPGGFTFDWKEKGSSFGQGETFIVDDIESEAIRNAIKGKEGFGTNIMHLTGRDGHIFEGLNSTNLIAGMKLRISYRYYCVNDNSFLVLPMSAGGQSGTIDKFDTKVIEGNIKSISFEYVIKAGDIIINFYPNGNSEFDIYMGNMTVELLDYTAPVIPEDQTANGFKVGYSFTVKARAEGNTDGGSQKVTNNAIVPSEVTGEGFEATASLLEYKNAKDVTMPWFKGADASGKCRIEKGNTYKISVVYSMHNYDGSRWMINVDNQAFLPLEVGEGYHKAEVNWVAIKDVDNFSFYIPGDTTVTNAKIYIAYTTVELVKIGK